MMNNNFKSYINEIWKDVAVDVKFINKRKLQVSNFGRLRSYFKTVENCRLISGSRQEGYAVARLKMYERRPAETQQQLNILSQQIRIFEKQIAAEKNLLAQTTETEQTIATTEKGLGLLQKKFNRLYKAGEKKRITHLSLLIHRLVADFFCVKISPLHLFVIHKDFNKLNNHYTNLQWATQEEVAAHQQKNPAMQEEKKARLGQRRENSKASKLTVMRVMLIKKRLLENTPMRRLARQFKVTETQIARIKKGENWKDIEARYVTLVTNG